MQIRFPWDKYKDNKLSRKSKKNDKLERKWKVFEIIHSTHLHLAHTQDCRAHKIIIDGIGYDIPENAIRCTGTFVLYV